MVAWHGGDKSGVTTPKFREDGVVGRYTGPCCPKERVWEPKGRRLLLRQYCRSTPVVPLQRTLYAYLQIVYRREDYSRPTPASSSSLRSGSVPEPNPDPGYQSCDLRLSVPSSTEDPGESSTSDHTQNPLTHRRVLEHPPVFVMKGVETRDLSGRQKTPENSRSATWIEDGEEWEWPRSETVAGRHRGVPVPLRSSVGPEDG